MFRRKSLLAPTSTTAGVGPEYELGMFRREGKSCLRKIPVKHTDRLEELTDLHLATSPLSPAGFGPTNSYI
eukprot:COSAG02_NODE_1022_length_15153_cov_3.631460_16_plen_71_part_00